MMELHVMFEAGKIGVLFFNYNNPGETHG